MEVQWKPGTIDIIEKKRLQWYGHIKRMPEERIPKLIMEWIQQERRKRGRPRRTWMEGVQAAMTTRNLEPDQWRNRGEWRLVSGRQRQLLKIPDRQNCWGNKMWQQIPSAQNAPNQNTTRFGLHSLLKLNNVYS